jgi:Flp pilus assembly pilin Flp
MNGDAIMLAALLSAVVTSVDGILTAVGAFLSGVL